MKSQQSQLSFVNFVVTKFKFDKKHFDDEENKFEILPQAIISRSKEQLHINIELEILDTKNEFILKMLSVGIFNYKTDNEENLMNYMSVNGPAIIFPYIRSFISSFTSLSGFDTITLPTLNLSGFKDEIIKNLIDLDKMEDE